MSNLKWLNFENKEQLKTLTHLPYSIENIAIDKNGTQCAFQANFDSLKSPELASLHYWSFDMNAPRKVLDRSHDFLPPAWIIAGKSNLYFSADGKKLIFGMVPKPLEVDTNKLEDRTPQVEVWNYRDARLYTHQKVEIEKDKKKAYLNTYTPKSDNLVTLTTPQVPEILINKKSKGNYGVGFIKEKYLPLLSWEGRTYRDLFSINIDSGKRELIKSKVSGDPDISPAGSYSYWYEPTDSSFYIYHFKTKVLINNKSPRNAKFYDEENDRPDHPSSYGVLGWTTNDGDLLVYDRYDIWALDPMGQAPPDRLTSGRKSKRVHRYIRLDEDEEFVEGEEIFLHIFDEESKAEAYAKLDFETGQVRYLLQVDKRLSTRPHKAKFGEKIIYTEESFTQFPDIFLSDLDFRQVVQISDVNPQQANYLWGTIEQVQWTDFGGIKRSGLLAKPENFDPSGNYPMIVNFYERSADNLHSHRPPVPGRSTIGYAFYVSNGYLVFNPDVHYATGFPGQSAYDAVVSGTQAMVRKGFVDSTRIGLQGHSWGGYQIADIITRTNMFRCAEAGAPVVNMISAYGGIRWGSGLSRMFQYEHTQSRLGATLWERPDLYLENSPIFRLNKIETPVLILHNDHDTAVPWYQGIEFFVGMRRLGKPAWLLNYNGEPHWPLKWPNRLDFNRRMLQFFNHFLKDEPMPVWMSRGIPAVKEGIIDGLELETQPSGSH